MALLSDKLKAAEDTLRRWQILATSYRDTAAAGQLDARIAERLLADTRNALAILGQVPRTAEVATKATVEWSYAGTLAADFNAVEAALHVVGDWIAARDDQLWVNYSIGAAYPWTVTIVPFTSVQTAGLQTALNGLITALNTIVTNIQ